MNKWSYHSTPGQRHGAMICTACRKPIEDGDYRVRETSEAYHPQHRICSEDDAGWLKVDKARAANGALCTAYAELEDAIDAVRGYDRYPDLTKMQRATAMLRELVA